MQFDDDAICGYAICALGMQEMGQSARAINVWCTHQQLAPQSNFLKKHQMMGDISMDMYRRIAGTARRTYGMM